MEEDVAPQKSKTMRGPSPRGVARRHTQPPERVEAAPAAMPQSLRALRTKSEQTLRSSSRSRVGEGKEAAVAGSPWASYGNRKDAPKLPAPAPQTRQESYGRRHTEASVINQGPSGLPLKDCALCGRSKCCTKGDIFCEECSSRMDVLGPTASPAKVQQQHRSSRLVAPSDSSFVDSDADTSRSSSSLATPEPHRQAEEVCTCVRCGSRFVREPSHGGSKSGSMLCQRCR